MQVLGSSPDFLSWSFCLVEVCPHEMSSLSISLAALWEAWLEGWVPGERAAGTEAVAMEVGYWGPPHPPSDQGQTLGVSHGKGVLGRLWWAPAWRACLSASVPLEGTSSAPSKQRGIPRRSLGAPGLCSRWLCFQAAGPANSSAGTRGRRLSAPALWGTSCSQTASPAKVSIVLLREPLPPLDTQAGPALHSEGPCS